ncbi:MAG: type VI secretion system membrane subunit TssM, partial [Gammaproteobacteria bacterium]|nr:type VI secretion system membrane subunit TssM [Gammaproteobacteria bacterium]
MKRLFRFLTQRWIIGALGIIALMILIWFGGPYLGIGNSRPLAPEFNRLLAGLVIAVLWGVNNLRLRWKANKANAQMIDQLVTTPHESPLSGQASMSDASVEEVSALSERFEAALARLKQTNFRGKFGKQYLYNLPWYMIIGPPGSGKTTLLENSGLEFPLAAYDMEKKIGGVGGTRNCDWWFTNEAVLLDTAGRYTTQDSHMESDSRTWLGFLDLLSKHRPRRPLNGIIISVSLSDLQTQTDQELELHTKAIRQRVQELYTRLGTRIPVYMLFTKSDLVAGFSEYFDDLTKEEREQVWGITFPEGDARQVGEVVHLFGGEFDALLTRLNSRIFSRLHQERDQNRRDMIYRFPQQVANLKPLLNDFLQRTFRHSQYEQPTWLRGVYFTSGTQEGSPLDRIMGSLTATFGLSPQSSSGFTGRPRSFFINRLLRNVIFPEEELSSGNIRHERLRLWIQRGAYAGVIAITVGVIFAWSVSFTRSELRLGKLDTRIENFQAIAANLGRRPGVEEMLPALQSARDVATVYGDDAPGLMGMGLYQGFNLRSASNEAYKRSLDRILVSHVKQRLERSIRLAADEQNNVGEILDMYKSLNIYLMLGEPDTFNKKRFRSWVTRDWQQHLPGAPEERRQLTAHLDALLSGTIAPQHLDEGLMARARGLICGMALPEQVYVRLEQLADAANIKAFSVASLGREAKDVLQSLDGARRARSVPGFYTYDGYHEVIKKDGRAATEDAIEELRRLCEGKERELDKADPEQILRDVERRYYSNYIDRWNRYLAGVQLRPFKSLSDAANVLEVLSSPGSPLEELTKAITYHTQLERPRLAGVLEQFDAVSEFVAGDGNPVQDEFAQVHKLLRSSDDEPSPLAELVKQLRELRGYVRDIAEASDPQERAFVEARTRMEGKDESDVIQKLRNEANRSPEPVQNLVEFATLESWGMILMSARQHL